MEGKWQKEYLKIKSDKLPVCQDIDIYFVNIHFLYTIYKTPKRYIKIKTFEK